MVLREKQRTDRTQIADLIADSFFEDMRDWIHASDTNCYAFARGLTYPDTKHQYYSPGKIYQLKFGDGNVVDNENDPAFIDKCIMNDSIALKQKCERVSFSDIKETDFNFYFGITDFHLLTFENDHHWHFICRTPSGMWLHKPNWLQNVQLVDWIDYGKTFRFSTIAQEVGGLSKVSTLVPCEGKCFENYFYKLELPED